MENYNKAGRERMKLTLPSLYMAPKQKRQTEERNSIFGHFGILVSLTFLTT